MTREQIAFGVVMAFAMWALWDSRNVPCSTCNWQVLHATQSVELLSLTCDPNHGKPRATLTIRNGDKPLDHAKGVVAFGFIPRLSLFPAHLAPYQIATTTIEAGQGDDPACKLHAVMDANDGPVKVQ